MARVGIRQVAKAAGVSISTVSKAFNPNSGAGMYVSDLTLERVRRVARELNYTPNYGATLLRGQSPRTIGFSISLPEEVSASYLSDYPVRLLNGLGPRAREQGYQLLLINGQEYSRYLDIRRIDALVMASFQFVDNPREQEMRELFRRFNENGYPYVVINSTSDGFALPSIGCDNRAGMKLVAELLLRRGFGSVGFLGELTPNPQKHHLDRQRYLEEFLRIRPGLFRPEAALNGSGNGIPEVPRSVMYNCADGRAGIRFLHANGRLPRCIVCGNDDIAMGALSACCELRIRVPGELAVIGFDGDPRGAFSCPPLTTVVQPLEAFGSMAFDYLQRKIEEPAYADALLVPPVLVERGSC
ncbi:MAG: LacI family DNA-binding transcriptional regulator [Lentisphaeria bacterium]|nr:LacI family DNA-binding transcriptional regulator [Lentisphaeria bacterium]